MSNSTLPHEIWRPIPGWEGLYSASDRGRIRSEARTIRVNGGNVLRRLPGRILRARPDAKGYLRVNLWRGGTSTTYGVHRLVILAFAGPGAPGEEVRHLNGVETDNRADNLAWGTSSDNERDKVAHGTHHNAIKTHCPRGHVLREPNIVAREVRRGRRHCLACDRATSSVRRNGGDLQTVSDDYYRAIVGLDLEIWVNLPDD